MDDCATATAATLKRAAQRGASDETVAVVKHIRCAGEWATSQNDVAYNGSSDLNTEPGVYHHSHGAWTFVDRDSACQGALPAGLRDICNVS